MQECRWNYLIHELITTHKNIRNMQNMYDYTQLWLMVNKYLYNFPSAQSNLLGDNIPTYSYVNFNNFINILHDWFGFYMNSEWPGKIGLTQLMTCKLLYYRRYCNKCNWPTWEITKIICSTLKGVIHGNPTHKPG